MWVNPVHAPCFAILLVEPDQQAVLILTAIVVTDGATQQRHTMTCLSNCWDVFGHKVLVLHRHDGVVHTHHRANLIHAIATGVHNDFAVDVPMFRVDRPTVVFVLGQPRHWRIPVHFRPRFAGAARQCLTQLCGINITVVTIPKTTD